MVEYNTWNSADMHANLSLSGGDLVVTDGGPIGQKLVRGIQSFSTGKFYWEYTVTITGGSAHCVGWCNSVQPTSNQVGRTTTGHGWGYHATGRIYHNNTYDSVDTYSQGNIIMIAIDLAAGKLWFGVNGTWLDSGDPGAGTGEQRNDINNLPLFPATSTYEGSQVGTANFGASAFSYSVPSGFNAGVYTGELAAGTRHGRRLNLGLIL